jgi:ribonuclease BN (tRNA processing enzyme)
VLRLVVLGGSCASPNTGAGCSGYLIESQATRLLVDPGPGTLQELRRWTDFRSLSAVLVSHVHLDHVLDLLALRHALAYNPIVPRSPTPVWMPPGGAEFLARVTAPFDECDEPGTFDAHMTVREFDPAAGLPVGDIAVGFLPAIHYLPCWAMRFAAGGRSIGYTADTGPVPDLAPFFADVDVLLAEATLLTHDSSAGQPRSLTAADAGRLAGASRARRLVLTHYWEEHGPAELARLAAAHYSEPIDLARPGLSIDLSSDDAGNVHC